jgi:asparagine synthase (glutamine-hydrolysing)
MVTICGWMKPPSSKGAEDMEATLVARLAAGGFAGKSTETVGLYARGGETACAAETGMFATVVGRLRWEDDAMLACHARDYGNAHALLTAYQKHGTGCLQLLRGDFALAIMDSARRSALLAIDRMGIQPLYYGVTVKGQLVFGTTTDLVRTHPDVGAEIDPQALFDYVYFHLVPGPGTIYRDIYKLQPAQYVQYRDDGKLQFGHYWRPRFREDNFGADVAILEQELKETLRASVMRCAPDDQTGAFLSGGLDSSTVCGLLAKASDQQTHAYTIGFKATGYDEMEYARIAARHFNLILHEYYITPTDIVEAIPCIAHAYDEPFGNSSAVPTLFCARLARQHGSRVMLAGDGGDELFAGNTRYVKQKVFELYSLVPGWLRGRLLEALLTQSRIARRLPLLRKACSYIDQARMPMPGRTESYNYLHRTPLAIVFEGDFLESVDVGHPLAMLNEVYGDAPAQSMLNRMLYLDWKFTLADNDLRKVMRMCATGGVEVRFPMLDEALVDFSLRVPPCLKVKGFRLRYFYKQALDDFLPRGIIRKSKHGFGLPFGEWLKASAKLQDLIYSSLHALKAYGVIRATFIDSLIATHRNDHAAYHGTMIWILALLEQWFQQHGVRP